MILQLEAFLVKREREIKSENKIYYFKIKTLLIDLLFQKYTNKKKI